MLDEQLNTAIDEVARQMTEGSPAGDAGFRRRVLARIESGDAPRARWRPLFVVAPLAAVAVILLALVVARQAVRLPPSPHGFGGTRKPDTTDVGRMTVQLPPSQDDDGATRKPNATDAVRATVRLPPPPSGFGGTTKPDTLPIDPLDPLEVAPLGVDPLAPDPIPIERLETIVPLVIAPLDSIEEQRRHE